MQIKTILATGAVIVAHLSPEFFQTTKVFEFKKVKFMTPVEKAREIALQHGGISFKLYKGDVLEHEEDLTKVELPRAIPQMTDIEYRKRDLFKNKYKKSAFKYKSNSFATLDKQLIAEA
jgi:hypothetical protein